MWDVHYGGDEAVPILQLGRQPAPQSAYYESKSCIYPNHDRTQSHTISSQHTHTHTYELLNKCKHVRLRGGIHGQRSLLCHTWAVAPTTAGSPWSHRPQVHVLPMPAEIPALPRDIFG